MSTATAPPRVHGPSLISALVIMVAGTLYPPLMTDAAGHPDYLLAVFLSWAMSAGFIRGVGFVPHHLAFRWLFSGAACLLAAVTFLALKFLR
ncbi:MAG: cyd operon YbgE family protein [Bradyrhizobium sp.]